MTFRWYLWYGFSLSIIQQWCSLFPHVEEIWEGLPVVFILISLPPPFFLLFLRSLSRSLAAIE
jgi:hypothetical protein